MEGAQISGGVVEAVQAGGEEIQVVQEGLLLGLVGMVFLEGQLLLEVAAEGRGGQAILGGQGAVSDPGQEGLVDLVPGGVVADGTTLVHLETVFGFQFAVFGKRIG